jgi:peptidoglycan/LPS O-acetylase OafA/YrhL
MALAMATGWLEIMTRAGVELGQAPYRPAMLVAPLMWSGAVLFILASFLWRDAVATALARQSRAITLMGKVTYPLYLVHYQVGGPLYAALAHRGGRCGGFVPAYGLAVVAAGVLPCWWSRRCKGPESGAGTRSIRVAKARNFDKAWIIPRLPVPHTHERLPHSFLPLNLWAKGPDRFHDSTSFPAA